MTDSPAPDGISIDTDRERAMLPVARTWVRAWTRVDGGHALDTIGRDAIRASTDATARLSRFEDVSAAAQLLSDVEAAVAAFVAPPPPRPRWWSSRRDVPVTPPSQDVFLHLAGQLDQQRDETTRRLIVLATDLVRIGDADRALEDAIHLLRALAPAIEAAAREIRAEDPARAATLHDRASTVLIERQRAVLTQIAINRQALLACELLIANQKTLGSALEQARTATLSAVQVATAARQAGAEQAALSRQNAALLQTAAAAGSDGTAHAHRMLADAVAQARAAIATMTPAADR